MPSESKICFFSHEVNTNLANRKRLKRYVEFIFKKEGKKLEFLNCIFCTDKALLEINRKYLQHDFLTDVITFDLSDKVAVRAEIYISIDRVRENARKLCVSFKSELLRVFFHGVLHLCEYRDKTKAEKEKIREKEDHYLKKYNLWLSFSA